MRVSIMTLAIPVALVAQQARLAEKLVSDNDCSSCHARDRQVVGPSYAAIAKRYSGQANAAARLAARIREGGSGSWGAVAMTPHPNINDGQARQIVDWVLSVKEPSAAASEKANV